MSVEAIIREFEPGTTGWSADDLDDPAIEAQWCAGDYEIVEGVLTRMPAAYFDSTIPFGRFIFRVQSYLKEANIPGDFGPETDYVLNPKRVARPDMVYVTPDDLKRNLEEKARRGQRGARLRIRPTLAIECVSLGHESHDRELKRTWYAEAGVPNYWLFDAFDCSIEALAPEGKEYRTDCIARNNEGFRPALFPRLVVPLKDIWI
jgi:Uma2 family endonuclease